MTGILEKLTSIVGGSLFKEAKEVIMAYLPPEVPPEKRLEMQAKLNEIELSKSRQIDQAIADAEMRLTERIALTEGSAQDLRALPVVGSACAVPACIAAPCMGLRDAVRGCHVVYGALAAESTARKRLVGD